MVKKPTRGKNILDLIITSNPNIVSNETHTSSPSHDHDAVFFEMDIRPKHDLKPDYFTYLFSKADMENLELEINLFTHEFCTSRHLADYSIDENWDYFKTNLLKFIENNVPLKRVKSKRKLPWITTELKRKIRKRERLYKKAKISKLASHWQIFKSYRNIVKRHIQQSHESYVNEVVGASLEEGNAKSFWNYIRLKRTESIGVPPLRDGDKMETTNTGKANLLNTYFKSVFTVENTSTIPVKGASPYPDINPITFSVDGIEKLLRKLKPRKAAGPDQISPWILKNFASQCAMMLCKLFDQSYNSSCLPEDWKKAVVTPVHKKGDKTLANNYRPISLTCISCKVMEHIVCSSMYSYLSEHNILTTYQHGFRKGTSTLTQLISVLDDWAHSLDNRFRTDVFLIDFSKAFDTVPHKRLLAKLRHYGIRNKTLDWIQSFLTGRTQCVHINGERSTWLNVTSGVPQGSVLGPLLFITYINDIVLNLQSKIKLFADDAVVYREIRCPNDKTILQNDINTIISWANTWQMKLNKDKCNIMSINRSKSLDPTNDYHMADKRLGVVSSHKYLGVFIQNDLQWDTHVREICTKASKLLGMLRRNLSSCSPKVKETAYYALVRPGVEYASPCWSPHEKQHINRIESINRSAARFVLGNYSTYSSVTAMKSSLGWDSLEHRRTVESLAVIYKSLNNITYLQFPDSWQYADARTRSNHPFKFRYIHAKSNVYKFSFFPRVIPLWNSLSFNTVNAPSLASFKINVNSNL